MKKAIKKLMAALLAVAMLCAMAVPAFADGSTSAGTTYTITINNPVGTYKAYQIFSGDLEGNILSNIVWGTGVTEAGKTDLGSAKDRAATLTNELSVKAFAKEVSKYLGESSGSYADGKISGLAAGYYLIKNDTVGDNETYTSFILAVVKDVTVSPKGDKPTLEKKVKDANDTDGTTTNWQDSADHDIGDDVPFKLTAKIASNFDDYTTYKFVFHDEQSAGLTFKPDTVEVTVGGTKLTPDKYDVITSTGDKCTFHVVINDLKQIPSAAAGAEVAVEYKSTLNEHAVIGSAGNPNEAYLGYSNNPHNSNDTTTTPKDKVTVFTFKVVANKINGDNDEALKGAAFALYKKGQDSTWKLVGLNNATEANGKYTIVDPDQTKFDWVGLDDGEYKIEEIITPAGFNSIDPKIFRVTATHDEPSADPKLTALSGNMTSGEITFTPNKDDGSLTTKIVNNAGATLPSTGGIGTTIFYVVGGGLMVAAAVLLITKKRMENK